jgi:hypothetical protein
MSTVQNNKIKKNNTLGIKPKKKTIPININTNPVPGKFLFSNQVNNIASSYLSMGRRIQINKNNKTSKTIHVNTNSATNYYTLNSKDSKLTNGSLTNSLFTNGKNNNMSEINTLNINYFNVSNNKNNNHNQYQNYEINPRMKSINSKEKKNLSTFSNSHISNEKLFAGYENSNNGNNNKSKNKINSANTIYNLTKLRQTYSTRANFLDSRNKTKKVPMKSKIRQFKYQYKNKSISTSFNNNAYSTKRHFNGSHQRELYNFMKEELLSNLSNDKKLDSNNFEKRINYNYIHKNKALYETKNKHFRNNTVNFGGKELLNIFHKKTLSNLNTNLYNNNKINNYAKININKNLYINNENNNNNNRNNNLNQIRNSIGNNQNYCNNEENPFIDNIITKKNNEYNSKKKVKKLSKGKINDIKICINEKKINTKEARHNQNNSNIINFNYNNHILINKNISNNNSNNTSNIVHHIKHPISNNINISGIKKILIRKESKKLNYNQNQNQNPNQIKVNNNKLIPSIPTPMQKNKNKLIPSQRNIKINLAKFLQNAKNKQNNKLIVGRKTLSIKKIQKENKSDFSITQLKGKRSNKIIKNGNNENLMNTHNKTINEEIPKNKGIIEKKNNNENELKCFLEGKIGNDINFIANITNKNKIKNNNKNKDKNLDNISENITEDLINDIYRYNLKNNKKNKNQNNNNNVNCNSSNSTNNNINYGNIKNDYSVDNVPEPINKMNQKNQIDYYSINNIIDFNNSNINNNNNKEGKNNYNCNKDKINKNYEKKEIDIKNVNTDNDGIENYNENNIKPLNDEENNEIINNKDIHNNLFDEENLDELPDDYDENFNDLYSIINKINFGSVLVCVEGFFTPEGRAYKRYKEKFDKFYDKFYNKKGYSFSNSNNKPKKIIEVAGLTSNTKTNSSSSKKKVVSPNAMYNDLNIVKELNVKC